MAKSQIRRAALPRLVWLAGLSAVLCGVAAAESGRGTAAQAAYYFDSRDFNTLTLVASTGGLPLGTAVWGFVDQDPTGAGTKKWSEALCVDRHQYHFGVY